MANQIVVSAGAKVRDLQDVIIGTSGVLTSLGFDVANGVPRLDVNGKILVSQLPNSVMEYKGTWNAATNTPTLANGTGNQGDVYLCNVAGTVNFGAGPIAFVVGDQVIYSGSIWQRASGATGTVTSVAVTESGDSLNITGSPITTSGTINIGFNGTNLQYVNGAGNLTTFPTLITSIGLSMPSAFSVANSPLTANGTIAVTGAGVASQYIRGDGTLADFPSSGGGGSSVSYYLNGGTSQGTIGGTTYYEMSKTAVIGTGVDFAKSGDGFIVAFLTDANDPAQLNIPAGNWNYEIYASMSSNGGTPEMYAELYVYDGTTFTLISTSPHEILYDGTALNLYTFAMAVPATSLTLTDRLAVKLYATNSGGKTTTIHTQDSHLCQIITTFSTGITALNGLTAQVQYFQVGTSGTDFNISSTTATHTFNIPDASASARGLITTGTQTIAGTKTFSDATKNNGGIFLQNASSSSLAGYMNIGGLTNGVKFTSGGGVSNTFTLPSATGYTFTFPNATGTIALTSDIPSLTGYVPYTGATTNVNLGVYSITTGSTATFSNASSLSAIFSNGGAVSNYNAIELRGGTLGTSSNWQISKDNSTGNAFELAASTTNGGTTYASPVFKILNTGVATFTSSVTATSFVKTSGTSAQFLKADGSVDSSTYLTTSSASSTYLPLAGGTLTGALNINLSSGTAMNVAGNAIFRGDTGVGTPRQLIITSGGSTPVYLEAKGYGANYQTDFGIKTFNSAGTAFEVFYADSSGRVGINRVAPSYQLDVNGTGRFEGALRINGGTTTIYGSSEARLNLNTDIDGEQTSGWLYANSNATLGSIGNVYIQALSTTVLSVLDFNNYGNNTANGVTGNVFIGTSVTQGIDKGAVLSLGGWTTSTGSSSAFGRIAGRKENATSGNQAGYLSFETANALVSQSTEKMRITSTGAVLVNATSSTYGAASGYNLGVKGTSGQAFISIARTGQSLDSQGMILGLDTAAGQLTMIDNLPLTFATNNAERMRITSGGNVLIGTTTDGGQKLQVDGMSKSGISYRSISYTDGNTTPSVLGASFMFISNSSPTTITNFTNGIENQIITLIFANSNTTINRSNCYLSLGLNFTSTSADTLTLINYAGLWYEVSRSVNS
jgi:hypothetical protein